jgi:hypothetical protein
MAHLRMKNPNRLPIDGAMRHARGPTSRALGDIQSKMISGYHCHTVQPGTAMTVQGDGR